VPDFTLHRAGTIVPVGLAGPKEIRKVLFATFSEMNVTAEVTIVEGDSIV